MNTFIKILKVPFLAIWPLVGGASGWFLTIQVNLHVVSFWIFRNTCILNLILTEREVQCSLTAETRANGKVNFSTINIRPLSYYAILGGEHYWRRRMQNCMDLTRPWTVETSLMPLLTSLEGWGGATKWQRQTHKVFGYQCPNDIHEINQNLVSWSDFISENLQNNNQNYCLNLKYYFTENLSSKQMQLNHEAYKISNNIWFHHMKKGKIIKTVNIFQWLTSYQSYLLPYWSASGQCSWFLHRWYMKAVLPYSVEHGL